MTEVQDTTRRATRWKCQVTGLVILHTVFLGGCNWFVTSLGPIGVVEEAILTRMTWYEGVLPILATWVAVGILWRWERIGYALLALEAFLLPLYYQASKVLIFGQHSYLHGALDWYSVIALVLLIPGIFLLQIWWMNHDRPQKG